MKKYAFILLLIGFSECKFQKNENCIKIEANTLKKAIEQTGIELIDLRTPSEYQTGHIANAKNIDFLADDFIEKIKSIDKNQPIYLYCRSGKRSEKAAKILYEYGFITVYDLKGGIIAWRKANEII